MNQLGAVIINWNTAEHLMRCIESFLAEGVDRRNVLVVDQGSTDGSVSLVRSKYPNVRLLEIAENRGYGHAVNQAFGKIKTEYVVVSNADIVVHAGALNHVLQTLGSDESIALAGCRLEDVRGKTVTRFSRTSITRSLLLELTPRFMRGTWRDIEQRFHRHDRPFDVTYVEGAFMVLRRSAFEDVGGFDEGFSFFFEDADLPWRFIKAGYRVVHVPQATVTHVGGASFSQVPLKHAAEFHKNLIRLYKRHALRRSRWLARFLKTTVSVKWNALRLAARLTGAAGLDQRAVRNQTILASIPKNASPPAAHPTMSFGRVWRGLRKKPTARPIVSIIIPTYNRTECLLGLLKILESQTYDNFEVLVIDQSEEINRVKQSAYKRFESSWRVIRPTVRNRSQGKNVGILNARGEILLFCDDDIIPERDFVETHVKTHETTGVGGVSCRTLEDGLPYTSSKNICRVTFYGRLLAGFQSDTTCFVGTLVGGNMSVKRGVLLETGYFESLYRGTSIFEEQDFSSRMTGSGYKILFTNRTSVHHDPQPGGNNDSKTRSPGTYYHDFHHNEIVYFLKNRNHFCLFLVVPFCLLRSIKQSIRYKLSILEGIHIFSGVFEGFRTYYRSLR